MFFNKITVLIVKFFSNRLLSQNYFPCRSNIKVNAHPEFSSLSPIRHSQFLAGQLVLYQSTTFTLNANNGYKFADIDSQKLYKNHNKMAQTTGQQKQNGDCFLPVCQQI